MLLVGDFILDRYVYGDVERINPEAPVPVLHIVRQESRVGGAGNVAAAVPALGAKVCCVGLIGNDAVGKELRELLEAAGASTEGLIRLEDRPTAVKTRFVGLAQHRHPQQMLRVDDEATDGLDADLRDAILREVGRELERCDIVVLEDYNKGIFSGDTAGRIIAAARKAGKPVVVDPALLDDYSKYRGASVLKPNRYEAGLASGIAIKDDATLELAADKLLETADAQAVVITLDREGAYVKMRQTPGRLVPHLQPRSVNDVSGAGDETLAVLAVAMANGCGCVEAIELANVAGGLEVERFGFVPVTRQEMIDELRRMIGLRDGKTMERQLLSQELHRRRQRGDSVVFTNGCFDLLHLGHVTYLQQARQLGSCLVVAINSDDSVRRLKGPTRPVIGQAERAAMLGALECVDYVTIFDEDTPVELLELLRPDFLVKGGTTPKVVGQELVEAYGGKVRTLDMVAGLSTTDIINRILGGTDPASAAARPTI